MRRRPALRLDHLESRDVPTFIAQPSFSGGFGSPQDLAVADFDGDGNQDFAVANGFFGGVDIEFGAGDGTFPTNVLLSDPVLLADPIAIATADFNGDGAADLAVVNAYGGFGENCVVLLNNGDGTFAPPVVLTNSLFSQTRVRIGDFNGDGNADVLDVVFDGYQVFLGNGDGTFASPGFVDLFGVGDGLEGFRIAVADFDGDGNEDFAGFASQNGNLVTFLGAGDGTFASGPAFDVDEGYDLAAADFDGDGLPDLVVAGANGTQVFPNTGGAVFGPPTDLPSPLADSVLTGDFDGNGTPDVAVFLYDSPTNPVDVYYNDGVGGFTPDRGNGVVGTEVIANAVGVIFADGDANPDLVVIGFTGGEGPPAAQILLNDIPSPTTTFLAPRPNPVGPSRPVILTAEVTTPAVGGAPPSGTVQFFDGAGTLLGSDVVAADGTATITITSLPSPGFFTVFAVYSGDGDYRTSTSQTVRITVEATRFTFATTDAGSVVDVFSYTATPTGVTPAPAPAFDLGPQYTDGARIASADFNGDGVADIVVGSSPALTPEERAALGAGPQQPLLVSVFDGATKAVLTSFQPFESSFTGGLYVAAGDVNGDGVPDIAVSADIGGGPRVLVYLTRPDGTFGGGADFFAIDDPNFRGGTRIAIGDVNGDGAGDLIVVAGPGGGPRVAIYDGRTLVDGGTPTRLRPDFFALDETLTDGAFAAAGDVNGDGNADLVFGAGKGGTPRVVIYDGFSLFENGGLKFLASFEAGPKTNTGGIRVAMTDINFDGKDDLITGAGAGDGSEVRSYLSDSLLSSTPTPFDTRNSFLTLLGGVYVG